MKDYETFKAAVVEQLEELVGGCTFAIEKIAKVNRGTLDALSARYPGDMFAPCIYIEDMYAAYMDGASLDDIVRSVATSLKRSDRSEHLYRQAMGTISNIKKRVYLQVVGKERNLEVMKDCPHRCIEDLLILYYILVKDSEEGLVTVQVTYSIAEEHGLNEEELFRLATANTKRLLPTVIIPIVDLPVDLPVGYDMYPPIYILTNQRFFNGASAILDNDTLSRLCEEVEDDLYLLPSSIHEVLAVPVSSMDPGYLNGLIQFVNRTELDPAEKLADHVYVFRRSTKMEGVILWKQKQEL